MELSCGTEFFDSRPIVSHSGLLADCEELTGLNLEDHTGITVKRRYWASQEAGVTLNSPNAQDDYKVLSESGFTGLKDEQDFGGIPEIFKSSQS